MFKNIWSTLHSSVNELVFLLLGADISWSLVCSLSSKESRSEYQRKSSGCSSRFLISIKKKLHCSLENNVTQRGGMYENLEIWNTLMTLRPASECSLYFFFRLCFCDTPPRKHLDFCLISRGMNPSILNPWIITSTAASTARLNIHGPFRPSFWWFLQLSLTSVGLLLPSWCPWSHGFLKSCLICCGRSVCHGAPHTVSRWQGSKWGSELERC